MKLSEEDFKSVIKNGIIPAIDLIIKNEKDEVLVGQRKNNPARGYWFVPGGRIYKNESFRDALYRICEAEVGKLNRHAEYRSLGIFNHIYDENFFGDPGFNTHYLTVGIELSKKDIEMKETMEQQHDELEFISISKILLDEKVHENTRFYFVKDAPNRFG